MTRSIKLLERVPTVSRRQLIIAAAGLATAGVAATWMFRPPKAETPVGPVTGGSGRLSPADLTKPGPLPELVLGKADAPVTIVEYADLTCPHCAHFHATVLPQLKKKYIDTGKARLLFREFPLNNTSLIAFMTVRCTGTEKALPLISALFARQEDWRSATTFEELKDKLFALAQQMGLTRKAFDACVPSVDGDGKVVLSPKQQKLVNDISAVRDRGHSGFGVSATPTFFVDGKKLPGPTIEDFDKAIAPLLKP